jgi:hypothetical protein
MRQGSGESALYVVSVESGNERRVTTAFFREYSGRAVWLSNQALVLSDLPDAKLFHVDIESGARRVILEPPPPTGDTVPLLSPDRKWLSFSRFFNQTTSDLFVVPPGGGSPRRLTFDEHAKREICWAPDSSGILYRMRTNYYGLWYVGLDGRPPHAVHLPFEPFGRFDVKPGADGALTLAIGETFSVESIWRTDIPADSGESAKPVRFISSGQRSVDVNPVISPDGLHVAFVSTRTGSPEIWVSDARASGSRTAAAGRSSSKDMLAAIASGMS